jgi:hypothetical protein
MSENMLQFPCVQVWVGFTNLSSPSLELEMIASLGNVIAGYSASDIEYPDINDIMVAISYHVEGHAAVL